MTIRTIKIDTPHQIRKMGTSGLRMIQEEYNRPLFLEQFSQGIADYFSALTDSRAIAKNNKTLLLGGDPRKGNQARARVIASILAANGFNVIIAENALASTPAMSHAIRKLEVAGGIILTASHNPFTDVGIKINMADGSPALEDTTDAINAHQNRVCEFRIADYTEAELKGAVSYSNLISLYADLLDSIFDFNEMRRLCSEKKITALFDAMHGAAGPFAREVFINRLGIDAKILREEPREDLGGFDEHGEPLHPEPDFEYLPRLIEENAKGCYDLVGAWDSDVDRRLDGGKGFFVESADEFALFAKYGELINISRLFTDTAWYCRSTVTAQTIDLMKEYLVKKHSPQKAQSVETPTGFKWIAELGNWGVEESNGVGNPYLREKDGIFATVFLLKIILITGKSPRQLMEEIWKDFGRVYFTRGEVSGKSDEEKTRLQTILDEAPNMCGRKFGSLTLEKAESWNYIHPLTGELAAKNAAYVLQFSDGNTVKARFSGTGSGGYTMRVYCSKFDRIFNRAKSEMTGAMKEAFDAFLHANGFSGSARKYSDEKQPEMFA